MMITMNKTIKKTSQGRKKIEIKKIEEVNNRQVTFSKRRTGIFKKAAELCVLTGSQIAVLVNSPGGRVYAFGHPNPEVIIDRYLNTNNVEGSSSSLSPPLVIEQFNQYYVHKSMELEAEKRQQDMIQESKTLIGDESRWYLQTFDMMEVDELKEYLSALKVLRNKVKQRADEFETIRKDPKSVGLKMMGPNMSDTSKLGLTNVIPNTMISTNSVESADSSYWYNQII